jgi:hypothetical protein
MPVPSYDPEHVAATSLKRTMLGITGITDIVDANKIFWMMLANETVEMPFVSIEYRTGGFEKNEIKGNVADIVMKMSIRTTDKSVANAFRAASAQLHRATQDTSDFIGVVPYATIWCLGSFRDADEAQGVPIYEVGGYYQLRFVIT